jgi:hypothetical protein
MRTVSPVTATQKVCLCRSATPTRISPNIINSTLTGPTDGTLPGEAETTSGSIISTIKKNTLLGILDMACKMLFLI